MDCFFEITYTFFTFLLFFSNNSATIQRKSTCLLLLNDVILPKHGHTPMNQPHLHPLHEAHLLESTFRKLIQKPRKILRKKVLPGMTVLDLGCGPGYFTLELAKQVGETGRVIALDVQEGMLDKLRLKLKGSVLEPRVRLLNNQPQHLGITDPVDFVLAFYAFHEMSYLDEIIHALKTVMKHGAKILIAEQKMHVSKAFFEHLILTFESIGFEVCERQHLFISRSVVMKKTATD